MTVADYNGLEIRFKSVHGFYLTGAFRDGDKAHQNQRADNNWTVWSIIDRGDGTIVLQDKANGRFLTAMSDGSVEAHAAIGAWEIWRFIDNGDGTVSFQSVPWNRFLTAMQEGPADSNGFFNAPLAQAGALSTWERWTIEQTANVVEVLNLNYQIDQAERLADQPKFIAEFPPSPNNTSVPQTMGLHPQETITVSSTFTQTTGIQVGAGVSVKVGVPEVAEAEVHVSEDFTHEWSSGMEQSLSKQVTLDFLVTVPPFSTVRGQLVANESNLRVPWTATARCRTMGGGTVDKPISGVWQGTSVWSVHAEWDQV